MGCFDKYSKNKGDISINKIKLNDDHYYNYSNINSYDYKEDEKYIAFEIKAEKNSIYNIKIQDRYLNLGGNNILKLNDNNKISFDLIHYNKKNHEILFPNYISLIPIGCDINEIDASYVILSINGIQTLPITLNHGFYQYIYDIQGGSEMFISINKINEKKSCMVFLSYFLLETNNNNLYLDTGLILDENISPSFLLDKNYKEIKFYYPHTEVKKNIILGLNLLNEGDYKITFYINEQEIKKKILHQIKQSFLKEKIGKLNVIKIIMYVYFHLM